MNRILSLLLMLLVLTAVFPAWAGDAKPLSVDQKNALSQASHSLVTVDDLAARGILSQAQAKEQRDFYLGKAQALLGEPIQAANLADLVQKLESNQEKAEEGLFQKITGLLTFANFIKTVAVMCIAAGLIWVFVTIILPMLVAVPKGFLEILSYVACFSAIRYGLTLSHTEGVMLGLLGCLGLIGCVSFTAFLHRDFLRGFLSKNMSIAAAAALFLALVWGDSAIAYQSTVIGVFAILALESFFGFSVIVTPLCYMIGFDDDDAMPRATAASFLILAFYVVMRMLGKEIPFFQVFSTGVFYASTFVFFIGLLIMSSKYYSKDGKYWLMQGLVFGSGLAAVYLGSVYNIPQLRGIGGVFFILYLIEKYVEIVRINKHWAIGTLGLGLVLYGCGLFVTQHPEYFMVF